MNVVVKIKKIVEYATIPSYANDGDAGMDLTITSIAIHGENYVKYGFGLAFGIPKGYVGYIFPRSSCYKQGQYLTNCVGVIDSGYTGEVGAVFTSGVNCEMYKVGDRACQIIIMPIPNIEFVEVSELKETSRGNGGFGSTGK